MDGGSFGSAGLAVRETAVSTGIVTAWMAKASYSIFILRYLLSHEYFATASREESNCNRTNGLGIDCGSDLKCYMFLDEINTLCQPRQTQQIYLDINAALCVMLICRFDIEAQFRKDSSCPSPLLSFSQDVFSS